MLFNPEREREYWSQVSGALGLGLFMECPVMKRKYQYQSRSVKRQTCWMLEGFIRNKEYLSYARQPLIYRPTHLLVQITTISLLLPPLSPLPLLPPPPFPPPPPLFLLKLNTSNPKPLLPIPKSKSQLRIPDPHLNIIFGHIIRFQTPPLTLEARAFFQVG